MPPRRPVYPKEVREKSLNRKVEALLPVLNKPAVERLSKSKKMFFDSPFLSSPIHKPANPSMLKVCCVDVLKGYRKRVHSELHAEVGGTPFLYGKEDLHEMIKELKREHDAVHTLIKGMHKENNYKDGTIIDSSSSRLRELVPELDWHPHPINKPFFKPEFKSRHFFLVIDSKIVPMVKFNKS